MTSKRYQWLLLGLALALSPVGCSEPGTPVAPMGASQDLSSLPEGERLAEENFQKKTKESEARNAAAAEKAAKKHR